MTTTDKLALKPFLETIEKRCVSLTREQLLDTLLGLAQTVPQDKRQQFLQNLTRSQTLKVEVAPLSEDNHDSLVDSIQSLREEVEERMASIEDGSYYSENNEAWYEYSEEDGADYFSDEQKQGFEQFLAQVGTLFLSNQLTVAKKGFEELFKFPLDHTSLNLDLRESRARYCRCLYETLPPERRVSELLTALAPEESPSPTPQHLLDGKYPSLQDLVDARPGKLPEFDSFLPAWQAALMNLHTDRAALLRLEANYLSQGLNAVATLAREWKDQQPYGYLFWIEKLITQADWPEVAIITQEALYALSYGEPRAKVADALRLAAEQLGETSLLLKGQRERCLSLPGEVPLLNWFNEAEKQGRKAEEITIALNFLANKNRLTSLYAKVCLVAGEIDKAFALAKEEKSYGWSYSSAGVVFAGLLTAMLPPKTPPSLCIHHLLEHYVEKNAVASAVREEKSLPKGERMIDQVLKGLHSQASSPSQHIQWIQWAEQIGRGRIEHILNNKFRKAYHRAAEVLVALAEYFFLTERSEHGQSLIVYYRDVQYPRHTAFRNELNSVIKSSSVLPNVLKQNRRT